jgi:type I pantothenate kinase
MMRRSTRLLDRHAPQLPDAFAPYRQFSREDWAALRADTPLTLTAGDLAKLRSMSDPISLDEVEAIYLPLSRLLSLYVAATQGLYQATRRFLLAGPDGKVPYIIGLAGSVSAGKSTTARILQALLSRWANTPRVALVTTDGFLFPNAELARRGLMERKGFPESYDGGAIVRFLSSVKSGDRNVRAPVYSHLIYDIVECDGVTIDRPDILIFEGLNVLQPPRLERDGRATVAVSDYFDFSIYLHAEEDLLRQWYVTRFMRLRQTAFRDPKSFFRRYAELSEAEATATAHGLWERINLLNLVENILPTRPRADLILTKGASHRIENVALRRL